MRGLLNRWHWGPEEDLIHIIPGAEVEGAQPMGTRAAGA